VDALVRSCGARLIPMLKNRARYADFSAVLNDPGLRARAVQATADLVAAGGYDGIHVDFEALRGEDSAGLSQFMAELQAKLSPSEKLTTMAISPKNEDTSEGWAGAYDFDALAAHADYLVLMAYGYHTSSNPAPGAYAPLAKVDRGLAYAVTQIPPSKLLLGLGLWGYDWNLSSPGPAAVRTYPETLGLAQRFGGTVGMAPLQQRWPGPRGQVREPPECGGQA
jgi:spore germination protein YaaH